jgi:tetratricopeptide (TPR) repeat protein
MTKTTFHAVLVAVAVAVGGSYPTISGAAEAVSAAVAKPLDAANKAIRAGKVDEGLAKLREVDGTTGKTAYDTYVMNQLLAYAHVRKNNYAEAAKAMEAQLASSFPSASEKNTLNKQLLGIYFNQRNYAKAVDLGNALVSAGVADSTTYNVLAQAYDKQGKLPEAVKLVKTRVNASAKPSENELLLLLDYQRRLKDTEGETATFEKLVGLYPKAEYWGNIIPGLLRAPGNSDAVTLGVYRLMKATGTLKRKEDFTEMAQLALEQSAPGEAIEILEKGLADNVFSDQRDKDRTNRLLESAKTQQKSAQAALPKVEADAKAGGAAAVALGRAYYGLGQYDKAVAALQGALAKGPVAGADDAGILLGLSHLRLGKKDEAIKAFKAVKSSDPAVTRLGSLWALHSRT